MVLIPFISAVGSSFEQLIGEGWLSTQEALRPSPVGPYNAALAPTSHHHLRLLLQLLDSFWLVRTKLQKVEERYLQLPLTHIRDLEYDSI